MSFERVLELLAKKMGQDASDREIAELNELLSAHPEYHYSVEILQSIEGEKKHYEPVSEEDDVVREGWLQLEKIRSSSQDEDYGYFQGSSRKRWLPKAAIWIGVAALAAGGYYGWRGRSSPDGGTGEPVAVATKQVSVPYGAPEKQILPDSTVVWLNAGSRISYADNFAEENREIWLEGEACFEVRSDAGQPFIVRAGNVVIHVLGTKFNIKAYDDENKIETTLINGKLQVQIADNPDKKIVLAPNEKLTVINRRFDIQGGDLKKQKELSFQVKEVVPLQTEEPLSEIPEIAWLQDKLAFQNEQFGELAKGLERRYNVHIIFKDGRLMEERLNGILENESIGKAMQLLQMTTPFHYLIRGDTVFLRQ